MVFLFIWHWTQRLNSYRRDWYLIRYCFLFFIRIDSQHLKGVCATSNLSPEGKPGTFPDGCIVQSKWTSPVSTSFVYYRIFINKIQIEFFSNLPLLNFRYIFVPFISLGYKETIKNLVYIGQRFNYFVFTSKMSEVNKIAWSDFN